MLIVLSIADLNLTLDALGECWMEAAQFGAGHTETNVDDLVWERILTQAEKVGNNREDHNARYQLALFTNRDLREYSEAAFRAYREYLLSLPD